MTSIAQISARPGRLPSRLLVLCPTTGRVRPRKSPFFKRRDEFEDLAALERAVAAREPQAPPHHRVAAAVGEHAA